MARVTVEDCIDKVESPYELVLVAKERAVQLNSGLEVLHLIEIMIKIQLFH